MARLAKEKVNGGVADQAVAVAGLARTDRGGTRSGWRAARGSNAGSAWPARRRSPVGFRQRLAAGRSFASGRRERGKER